MKTNKSFKKRLKVTKNGKVLARRPGLNHFNAKMRREKQLNKKGKKKFDIKKKKLDQNLPHK